MGSHPQDIGRLDPAERQVHAAMMADLPSGRMAAFDDVHSFVLRVSLNRSRGGQGPARTQYQLEYVNGNYSRRCKSLDEVLDQIRGQVAEILEGLGVTETI